MASFLGVPLGVVILAIFGYVDVPVVLQDVDESVLVRIVVERGEEGLVAEVMPDPLVETS